MTTIHFSNGRKREKRACADLFPDPIFILPVKKAVREREKGKKESRTRCQVRLKVEEGKKRGGKKIKGEKGPRPAHHHFD